MPRTAKKNTLDCRCHCSRCKERTAETYSLGVSCNNCGWSGEAVMRKGDKPPHGKECPGCGCSYVLSFRPMESE